MAGEMGNIVTKFFETFKIDVGKEKQDEHKFLVTKAERITRNVVKITAVLGKYGVTFDPVGKGSAGK